MARVVRAGLDVRHEHREVVESVLQEAVLHELPLMQRGLAMLAVIGAVAPLLGLLGTVTGMIETFRVITLHGTGDPKLMSGGISEALVTTEIGLAIAIPVMLLHTWLKRRVDHVVGDMEEQAVHLVNTIDRSGRTRRVLEATAQYLRQGGWIMWPLVGVSLVMWTLLADRWRELRGLRGDDLDTAAVLDVCRGEREVPRTTGLRARLAAGFATARTGRPRLDREILAQVSRSLDTRLERGLAGIAVLAAVAPLLGLLGTVLGMIETFQVISDFGTGNARALAGGVSVALVTTQTGLLVAIPGLLASGRVRRMAEELRQSLAETVQVIDRDLARRGGVRRRRGR